ncbi:uncharacterized protein [Henckelia pumila]|uniref:uncharacterized protein n=1 Tax=Henckelia pumila TaxID=405737 RepID=UPI003C6E3592
MNSFWWEKTGSNQRGLRWMSWDKLTYHKSEGGLGFRKIHLYHLALLSKQSWKLVSEPNSLVAQVFKAHYYTSSSFLEANLGANPRYVWRSLLETKYLLSRGVRRRIGSGHQTLIWDTPWLPDVSNPYIVSACPPGLQLSAVSSLRLSDTCGWDVDLLNEVFEERDKNLIQSIPLSQRECEDRWIWGADPLGKGIYTVKTMVLWGIWNARNNVVWNGKLTPTTIVFHTAMDQHAQWLKTNKRHENNAPSSIQQISTAWCPPPSCFFKCNVDAALFTDPPRIGVGCIICYSSGAVISDMCGSLPGSFSSIIAEALAIREVLKWINELNLSKVIVESDALVVVEALRSTIQDVSSLGLILEYCSSLASELHSSFSFVRRSANQMAHSLARSSGSLSGFVRRVFSQPSVVSFFNV